MHDHIAGILAATQAKKTGPANGPGLDNASACDGYGVTVKATRNATFGRTGSSLATQT